MKIRDAVSAFITAEPETSLSKRAVAILVPRTTFGVTAVLALTTVTAAGHGPLPQRAAETLVTQASEHAGIDILTVMAAGVILFAGEKMVMSIMEKIMKPLIAAGEVRGEARGEARGRAGAEERFEAWKQDQRRRGAVFADDEEETGSEAPEE